MIKRLVAFIFILVLAASLSIHIPAVQRYLIAKTEVVLSEKSQAQIHIGSISGLFPFAFNISSVSYKSNSQQVEIDSLFLLPAFPDLLLGRIGIFYLKANSLTIQDSGSQQKQSHADAPIASFLPQKKMCLYSMSIASVTVKDKKLSSVSGNFFWNPKSRYIQCAITTGRDIKDGQEAVVSIELETSPKLLKGWINGDVQDFIPSSPLKTASIHTAFTSSHRKVLSLFWGNEQKSQDDSTIIKGSYEIAAVKDDKTSLKDIVKTVSLKGRARYDDSGWVYIANSELQLSSIEAAEMIDMSAPNESPQITPLMSRIVTRSINGVVHASMHITESTCELHIDADHIQNGQFIADKLQGVVLATRSGTIWNCSVTASADVNRKIDPSVAEELPYIQKQNLPLTFTAVATTDCSTNIYFDSLSISTENASLNAKLQLFFYPLMIKGNIKGAIGDCTPIARLFHKNVSGSAIIEGQFDKVIHNQEILQLEQSFAGSIKMHNLHTPYFNTKKACLYISTKGLLPKSKVTLQVECYDASTRQVGWKNLHYSTSFDLDLKQMNIPFDISAVGLHKNTPLELQLTGSIQAPSPFYPSKTNLYQLTDFTALLNEKRIFLREPLVLTTNNNKTSLSSFEIVRQNHGSTTSQILLSGSGDIVEKSANLQFSFEKIPTYVINLLTPNFPLQGSFSGRLSIFGNSQNPNLLLSIIGDDAYLKDSEATPVLVSTDIEIQNTRCLILSTLQTSVSEMPMTAKIELPCTFQLQPLKFTLTKDEESLKGSIQGDCELSTWKWFFDEDTSFEGKTSINMAVSGSCLKPKLKGSIKIQDGKFDIPATGCTLCNVNLTLEGKEAVLILSNAEGSDGEGGSFTAHGTITPDITQEIPFTLNLDMKKMLLLRKDLITIAASGKGQLIKNMQGLNVKANIITDSGKIDLRHTTSPGIPVLDLQYTYDGEQVNQEKDKETPIVFDIDLTSDRNPISIVTSDLQSKWAGKFKVGGTASALNFYGKIYSIEGSYNLAGKKFQLENSEVEWNGPILTHSKLNIQGSYSMPDLEAKVIVRGSLEEPKLSLQSNPSLPQKEILSRVLFNKPLADISPVEGLQLAQTFLSVNSKQDNFNFIHKIKASLGIDTIDISQSPTESNTSGNSNAVSVQVGKYISKGVFVKLSKDVTNEVNRVGVEAKVHKNVSVQAEVGDDSEGKIMLRWKKDY